VFASPPSYAVTLNSASYTESITGCGSSTFGFSDALPESISADVTTSTSQCVAVVSTSPGPLADIQTSASGIFTVTGAARITYEMALVPLSPGAPVTPINVLFSVAGSVSADFTGTGLGSVGGRIRVSVPDIGAIGDREAFACAQFDQSKCAFDTVAGLTLSGSALLTPDTPYGISKEARAGGNFGEAQAVIDPMFMIDPTFMVDMGGGIFAPATSLYALAYSPGVGITAAVPEPSTYALMLAGLGFVGFVAHRRRKSQATAA
jgi:hypothetical protein